MRKYYPHVWLRIKFLFWSLGILWWFIFIHVYFCVCMWARKNLMFCSSFGFFAFLCRLTRWACVLPWLCEYCMQGRHDPQRVDDWEEWAKPAYFPHRFPSNLPASRQDMRVRDLFFQCRLYHLAACQIASQTPAVVGQPRRGLHPLQFLLIFLILPKRWKVDCQHFIETRLNRLAISNPSTYFHRYDKSYKISFFALIELSCVPFGLV